tara:strand:+ start:30 stop:554 length:525 start_codon:yes stop_codon:yes gene_type:complete
MASTTIKVISSCKYLFIKSRAYTAGAVTGDIYIRNLETGTYSSTSPYTISYSGANNFGQILVDVQDLPGAGGVYELDIREGGTTAKKQLAIVKCDIDCCLVKLTNELIDCACDCARCSTSLAKAQKIYLLLRSAETAAENYNVAEITNAGYALDAMNKYKKAKEICDASCGCDC